MSTTTANLGLFKYDTVADANTAFSITNALNNNWDIIDASCGGNLSATCSLSENGYIKFSNGVIINYGQATVGTQEVDWEQPILNQNGVMGGDTYACEADSVNTNGYAYKAFDKDNNTYWQSQAGYPHWITLYIPEKAKITAFQYGGASEGNYFTAGSVQASNDNTNWTTLHTFTGITARTTYNFTNDNFYSYYRLYGTSGGYTHASIRMLLYYGTFITTELNDITFPQAFSTTNYAYSLAYRNGRFGDSYATSLTTTGMHIHNNSNADAVFYTAIGY